MTVEQLLKEMYKMHTDYDKLLKSDAYADGNSSDFDYGNAVGWKEAAEMVIFRLEKIKKGNNA
tara:strand:+ start:482 stop:670 length:189 start_codon:yes stop_codon:yes gene_type:complete